MKTVAGAVLGSALALGLGLGSFVRAEVTISTPDVPVEEVIEKPVEEQVIEEPLTEEWIRYFESQSPQIPEEDGQKSRSVIYYFSNLVQQIVHVEGFGKSRQVAEPFFRK